MLFHSKKNYQAKQCFMWLWNHAKTGITIYSLTKQDSGGCRLGSGETHYSDAILSAKTSQITSVSIVCSTVRSGTVQRKHQSFALLAFVRGIHRWPETVSIWWRHHEGKNLIKTTLYAKWTCRFPSYVSWQVIIKNGCIEAVYRSVMGANSVGYWLAGTTETWLDWQLASDPSLYLHQCWLIVKPLI